MSAINVTSVRVLNNPAAFDSPIQVEISYECLYALKHDLEWKLIYVGSAESEKYDQVLDSVLVGPVYPGQYRFVFQADPPDAAKLPPGDVVGVTALLLTCSYQAKEFLRVGYYVNVEYLDEALREAPPERPVVERLSRSILADKPRVTRFPVSFDPADDPGAAAAAAAAQCAATAEAAAAAAAAEAASAAEEAGLENTDPAAAAAGGYGFGGVSGGGLAGGAGEAASSAAAAQAAAAAEAAARHTAFAAAAAAGYDMSAFEVQQAAPAPFGGAAPAAAPFGGGELAMAD